MTETEGVVRADDGTGPIPASTILGIANWLLLVALAIPTGCGGSSFAPLLLLLGSCLLSLILALRALSLPLRRRTRWITVGIHVSCPAYILAGLAYFIIVQPPMRVSTTRICERQIRGTADSLEQAIRSYTSTHGALPPSLESLIPDHFEWEERTDPWDRPLVVEIGPNRWRIRSLGPNGVEEGDEEGDDIVVAIDLRDLAP